MAMQETELHTARPPGMAILKAELRVCQWILHGNGGCCVGGAGCDCECHQHAINPTELDENVKLKERFIVPAFGTLVLQGQTEQTMMLDHVLRIITQAPYPEDEANLPNGLYVLSTYTQLNPRCREVAVIVRNGTSRPIHMASGR